MASDPAPDELATYRRRGRLGATGRLPRPRLAPSRASAAALVTLSAGAATGAAALGSLELLSLAGFGLVAAAAHGARAWRARRRHEAVARFLGSAEFVARAGTWTSPDGGRRLRARPGDAGLRLERIEPRTGVTRASYRTELAVAELGAPDVGADAGEWREAAVATVHGRPIVPCCFSGLPPELGGAPVLDEVRGVRLLVGSAGVLVERFGDDAQPRGDTLHATVAGARRQLEREFGPHLGRLRRDGCLPAAAPDGWDGLPCRGPL